MISILRFFTTVIFGDIIAGDSSAEIADSSDELKIRETDYVSVRFVSPEEIMKRT